MTIPQQDGESLAAYLDRLAILASRRERFQREVQAAQARLDEATTASVQLAHYTGLITADLQDALEQAAHPTRRRPGGWPASRNQARILAHIATQSPTAHREAETAKAHRG